MNKDIGHFYLVSRKQDEENNHYRGESSSDGNFEFFRYYEAKEYRFETAYLSEEHYDDWLVAYEVFEKYDDLLYPSDFVSLNEFEGPIKVDKWFVIGTKHLSKDVVYETGLFFKEINGPMNKGIYLYLSEVPSVDYSTIQKVIKEKE